MRLSKSNPLHCLLRGFLLALTSLVVFQAEAQDQTELAAPAQILTAFDVGLDIGDQYGAAVAISGDWAIIGASADQFARAKGAVYFWQRSEGSWTLKQKLPRPSLAAGSTLFGYAVAIHGDVAAVGSPYAEGEKVFIYRLTAGVWTLEHTLAPATVGRGFGRAVSVYGDRVLVGVPDEPSAQGSAKAGAARLYRHDAGVWELEKEFTAVSPAADAQFGSSVSLGNGLAAVGVPKSFTLFGQRGQVCVFALDQDGVTWGAPQILSDSTGSITRDSFGISVSVFENRLIIGASTHSNFGRAFIYGQTGGNWVQETVLVPSLAQTTNFGSSVSLSSGGALVSTKGVFGTSNQQGAMVYTHVAGTTWSAGVGLAPLHPIWNSAVICAIDGTTALVGASEAWASAYTTGSASVFVKSEGGWSGPTALVPPPSEEGAHNHFGENIVSDGATMAIQSRTGDGTFFAMFRRSGGEWVREDSAKPPLKGFSPSAAALSGDWFAVADQSWWGSRLYLMHRQAGGAWVLAQTVAPTDAGDVVSIGEKVAIDGDTMLVSCKPVTPGGVPRVLVFSREADQWLVTDELSVNETQIPAGFGNALALAGDHALVGAPASFGVGPKGCVYAFQRKEGKWNRLGKLPASSTAASANYATQILLDGDTAMVSSGHKVAPAMFRLINGKWATQGLLPLPSQTIREDAGFADSISLRGDHAAVASPVGTGFVVHRFIRQGKVWKREGRSDGLPFKENYAYFGWAVELTQDSLIIGFPYDEATLRGTAYVYPLAEMRISEGSAASNVPLTKTEPLEFGDVLVGTTAARKITISNSGSRPITPQWSAVSGPGAARFALTASSAVLKPGESATATVTFTPVAPGTLAASVAVVADASDGRVLQLGFKGRGVSTASADGIAMPKSQFFVLGQKTAQLAADVMVSEPKALQWLKDGKEIQGATERILVLPAVRSADAGTYQLRVRQGAQVELVSQPCAVGVYAPELLITRTAKDAKVTAQAWGPDLKFRFSNSVTGNSEDDLTIDGINTSVMRFRPLPRGEWPLIAEISMGELTVTATGTLRGDMRPLPIAPFGPVQAQVGVPFTQGVAYVEPGNKVLAAGLPPGLVMAPSGTISGVPTKAGQYAATFWVVNAHGASERITEIIWTSAQPVVATAGNFIGAFPCDDIWTGGLGGWAEAMLQPSGALTLSLRLGGEKLRLSGALLAPPYEGAEIQASAMFSLPNVPGHTKRSLAVNYEGTALRLTLLSAQGSHEAYLWQGWSDSKGEIPNLAPNQNILFSPSDREMGIGYGGLTLSASGVARLTGFLADGTSMTFSSRLNLIGGISFHHLTANARDAVTGNFETAIYGSNYYLGGGEAVWVRKPLASRPYEPEGFTTTLAIQAGRYFPPMSNQLLIPGLADQADNAQVRLNVAAQTPTEQLFRLTKSHTALFGAGLDANPRRVSLTFNKATGLFTGSGDVLVMEDLSGTPIIRKVSFKGMLLPEAGLGGGFFTTPQPFASPGFSKIISGRAEVQKQ